MNFFLIFFKRPGAGCDEAQILNLSKIKKIFEKIIGLWEKILKNPMFFSNIFLVFDKFKIWAPSQPAPGHLKKVKKVHQNLLTTRKVMPEGRSHFRVAVWELRFASLRSNKYSNF